MDIIRLIQDALLITGITLGASLMGGPLFSDNSEDQGIAGNDRERSKKNRIYLVGAHGICVLYTIARVFFCYQGQENSDYFFWHPYLAWLTADLFWILFQRTKPMKRLLTERLLLWPFVVIPVLSGIALCIGWLLKLYLRYFLPYKIY